MNDGDDGPGHGVHVEHDLDHVGHAGLPGLYGECSGQVCPGALRPSFQGCISYCGLPGPVEVPGDLLPAAALVAGPQQLAHSQEFSPARSLVDPEVGAVPAQSRHITPPGIGCRHLGVGTPAGGPRPAYRSCRSQRQVPRRHSGASHSESQSRGSLRAIISAHS